MFAGTCSRNTSIADVMEYRIKGKVRFVIVCRLVF